MIFAFKEFYICKSVTSHGSKYLYRSDFPGLDFSGGRIPVCAEPSNIGTTCLAMLTSNQRCFQVSMVVREPL